MEFYNIENSEFGIKAVRIIKLCLYVFKSKTLFKYQGKIYIIFIALLL